jgi:enterochelin esterase-like enzyme
MDAKLILLLCLLPFMIKCGRKVEEKPAVPGNGTIIQIDSFPSAHVEPRQIYVWLPSNYDSEKKYAVLYMQDGQMLFDSTITWTQQEWKVDETMTRLLKQQSIRDAIVVGIPNTGKNRWAEYVPQAILDSLPVEARSMVVQRWLNNNPLADHYLKFITSELKPYIDQHYSTHPEASSTFIMGSSMGGIISLYAICEYPDVFGGAACLSTHWPLNIPGVDDPDLNVDVSALFRLYLSNHLPSPSNHKIYFDYGTETLDRIYKPYQALVDTIMINRGYTADHWITKEFPGESHTETSWAKRLHVPLEFLLQQ